MLLFVSTKKDNTDLIFLLVMVLQITLRRRHYPVVLGNYSCSLRGRLIGMFLYPCLVLLYGWSDSLLSHD
jgi:hypothetical protein